MLSDMVFNSKQSLKHLHHNPYISLSIIIENERTLLRLCYCDIRSSLLTPSVSAGNLIPHYHDEFQLQLWL